MSEQLRVMISSTARDLPEHRKEVMDACLRMGALPVMMEQLTAGDATAAATSLTMVDSVAIYLIVLAYRYGYVPDTSNPGQISITEMEYNRALKRGITRLVFFMDRSHPLTAADMDEDTSDHVEVARRKVKLEDLKERAGKDRVAAFFESPTDLRALVIQALVEYRQPVLEKFHYVSEIPAPPEEYIAHPYTLLQTNTLIGRQPELKLLTDWITGKELEGEGRKVAADSVRVMSVIAIGGMGKSALTWKWFNEVAPQEMKSLAGRMWWSFYESDATFENFVIRALAYVAHRSIEDVQKMAAPDRETALLAALDRGPFLLALDGLERILIAYARMDAARLDDGEVGKEKNLRKTADPRVGSFFKKLAQVKSSQILVSSRLYPMELETDSGEPIPRTFRLKIEGLTDEDAIELWRAFGVSGSRDELLPVFATFGKHPLLIQALAGEVKRSHRANGDFEKWRKMNPQFDPRKFARLKDAMAHVLESALRGLGDKEQKVLQTIAAFRMPTGYDTLAAVLVGTKKACANEAELDGALSELEDRGLVGWDKRANRFDLHPIVRGVVWSGISDEVKHGIYETRLAHFESIPSLRENRIARMEDLTPTIELYHTLVGLQRYDDAFRLFNDRLHSVMQFRLSCTRQQSELLEILFPEGIDAPPFLEDQALQASVLRVLAESFHRGGRPGRAMQLYYRSIDKTDSDRGLISNLEMLSNALFLCAFFRKSEATAFEALHRSREIRNTWDEALALSRIGITMAARGVSNAGQSALRRALNVFVDSGFSPREGGVKALMAESELWRDNYSTARQLADKSYELAHVKSFERDFIRSARLQGMTSLGLGDLLTADERLHHALTRARAINYIEEELPAIVGLAELRRRQGDLKAARELVDDVWEPAERGPYPLFHADAFNVLAQIERDEDNTVAAIEVATKAYRLAWCDGPPFAYHWGLEKAKQHLEELGAPEPEMPAFDESKFDSMPDVEIDPDDEFHVGAGATHEP